jgi:hypothetical protein
MELHGITGIISSIRSGLSARCVPLDGYVLDGLSILAGCMLSVRTPNLMVLSEALPRSIALSKNRYQYIRRHLARDALDVDTVMSGVMAE